MALTRRCALAGLAAAGVGRQSAASAQGLLPTWPEIETLVVRDGAGAASTLGRLAGAPGRPVLLSFWASWCAPCIPEARHLAAVRARIAEADLAILGVNVEAPQDPETLAAFRERAGMTYTQGLADAAVFIVVTRERGLALPRAHLYSADGAVAAVFAGYSIETSPAAIDAAVDRVLRL